MGMTNSLRDLVAAAIIGQSYTAFNSANAHIGVGDGTTAYSPTQTDLQGSNKVRKGMESGYPTRSANTITAQALFGATEANFTWNEIGFFNASSGGTMGWRWTQSLGTKSSGQSWRITITLPITITST